MQANYRQAISASKWCYPDFSFFSGELPVFTFWSISQPSDRSHCRELYPRPVYPLACRGGYKWGSCPWDRTPQGPRIDPGQSLNIISFLFRALFAVVCPAPRLFSLYLSQGTASIDFDILGFVLSPAQIYTTLREPVLQYSLPFLK